MITTPHRILAGTAASVSRRRALGIVAILWAAGCAAAPPASPKDADSGRLLASISTNNKNGFFFYVRSEPNVAGPMLEGYELRDGKRVDSFGGGSDSAAVIEAIDKAGLEPFDFDREIAAVTARLARQAQQRGELFLSPQGRDGAEWDVVIVTRAGPFKLHAWNPGITIDAYAPHSEKIARLKAVLDLLAQFYGRLKIGL